MITNLYCILKEVAKNYIITNNFTNNCPIKAYKKFWILFKPDVALKILHTVTFTFFCLSVEQNWIDKKVCPMFLGANRSTIWKGSYLPDHRESVSNPYGYSLLLSRSS